MKNINEYINKKNIKELNRKNFMIKMEDKSFANLCYRLNIPEDELLKYTSKLENTCKELANCKNCKGIDKCINAVKGYVDFPTNNDNTLVFSYIPCKYKKEEEKNKSNTIFYETSKLLRDARLSKVLTDDESRKELLTYIKKFIKNYPNEKGIYLYGSFGSGKSYILNALINELSKKGNTCVSIYYPSLLKKLKDSFNSKTESYREVFNELEVCDVLLIDDIGAENNTEWARDEVLGSLLQSRMDNDRITLFTSNLDLKELEEHLGETSSKSDKVKARRIIERIKSLCVQISLIGENKRD